MEGILFLFPGILQSVFFLKKGFNSKLKDSDIGRHVIGARY